MAENCRDSARKAMEMSPRQKRSSRSPPVQRILRPKRPPSATTADPLSPPQHAFGSSAHHCLRRLSPIPHPPPQERSTLEDRPASDVPPAYTPQLRSKMTSFAVPPSPETSMKQLTPSCMNLECTAGTAQRFRDTHASSDALSNSTKEDVARRDAAFDQGGGRRSKVIGDTSRRSHGGPSAAEMVSPPCQSSLLSSHKFFDLLGCSHAIVAI
jgi:hypothetical protein